MPASKARAATRKKTSTRKTSTSRRAGSASKGPKRTSQRKKTGAASKSSARTGRGTASKTTRRARGTAAKEDCPKSPRAVTGRGTKRGSAAAKKVAGKMRAAAGASPRRRTARPTPARGELNGPYEQLWRRYAKQRDPALRNELMSMYLPVVNFIAERLLLTLPRSIELDDLKSAGVFGLMDAIEGFEVDRGIKFKTYCSSRIRGAILDELRSQDWVPRLVRLKAHQIARAQSALEARHGRAPTHAEMAQELGVALSDYSALTEEARAHTVRSLSESWDDGTGDQAVEKIDMVRDERATDPAELLNQDDVMRAIIRSLNRKEKQIILMYYRDGLTMKQIGGVLSLTESRVCQIHSNVMKKLKAHLEGSRVHLMI
jgi:RNA polymerase sigma factor for flagellar operon FliA